MPKFKSILKNIAFKPAGKKRKCYHDEKHSISKGEWVLEVDEGMNKLYGYCSCCALTMLAEAGSKVAELKDKIR